MHWRGRCIIVAVLLLVLVANGAPVVLGRGLGSFAGWPLDGGAVAADGRRVLGRTKTWRGLVAALAATAVAAMVLGEPWFVGVAVGGGAMAGDLLSSCLKRRMALPPSAMALGLDQLPEALIPAAIVAPWFGLGPLEILAVGLAFLVLELALSRLFFALGVRDRPY